MFIPFGEWLPDLPAFQNPGALTINNAYPTKIGYNSFPSIGASSTALTSRAQGAYTATDNTASVNKIVFAGDATKLYKLNAVTFENVSKTDTTYALAAEDNWNFVQFGTYVIAGNINDDTQYFDVDSGTEFDDLAGTPPRAKYWAVVRDFVVVANTWDASDLYKPKRARWCGIGDPESWSISAATQADLQDLEGDGGQIQGIVGGEYGIIFQERSIWRMTYVGSPIIFQFDEVERGRGVLIPSSIVTVGRMIFYIGGDGFYMFDGVQSTPIGNNKVDKFFFGDIDATYYSRVSASVDPVNKLILWAYPGSGSSMGNPNRAIGYRWDIGRFFLLVDVNIQFLFSALTQGLTLEELDAISTNIDALPYSLDSNAWTGGKVILAGFNGDNQLGYFTGQALDAVLETGEFQGVQGRVALIDTVRPIIDGGTVEIEMGTRNILTDDSVTYGTARSPNTIGECEVRSAARYHRSRVNISDGFVNAQGIECEPMDAGFR